MQQQQTLHQPSDSLLHAIGAQNSLHSDQNRALDPAPFDDSAAFAESGADLQRSRNVSIYDASDHSGETFVALPRQGHLMAAGVVQMVHLKNDMITDWSTQCRQALLPRGVLSV